MEPATAIASSKRATVHPVAGAGQLLSWQRQERRACLIPELIINWGVGWGQGEKWGDNCFRRENLAITSKLHRWKGQAQMLQPSMPLEFSTHPLWLGIFDKLKWRVKSPANQDSLRNQMRKEECYIEVQGVRGMTSLNGITQPEAIQKCCLNFAGRVRVWEENRAYEAYVFWVSTSVDGVRETGLLESKGRLVEMMHLLRYLIMVAVSL